MKGIRNVDTLAGGTIFPPGQQAREYWFLTEDEKVTITIGNSDGKPHKQWFLTEDGLYEVLMQSRKPIAKQFKKKVKEILKEIRMTGKYVAKPMTELEILHQATGILMEQQKQIAALESKQAEYDENFATVNSRIDTLDNVDIDGSDRDKLVGKVRKYALKAGIFHPMAWKEFVLRFNRAYNVNLEARKTWYKKNLGLSKKPSTPEYLEEAGLIPDGLRVADKMLRSLELSPAC